MNNKLKVALVALVLAGFGALINAQTKQISDDGDGNVAVLQIGHNGGTPTYRLTNNNSIPVIIRFVQPNITGSTFILNPNESRDLGAYAAYRYFVCLNGGSPVVKGTPSTPPEYTNLWNEVSCIK